MWRNGLFGEIEVKDQGLERSLYLCGQKQGGAYLRPSAATVDASLPKDAPGPVCSSAYALGWLVAGAMGPSSTVLMVGLGSGGGVVELLYNFPQLDLTVVEIDPVMAQMAIDGFPLLDHYLDSGRLNIVLESAEDFLANNHEKWDVGLADAYDGGQALLDGYMPTLCEMCEEVYVNVIDQLGGESMQVIVEMMDAMGRPVKEAFKAAPPYATYASKSNWILTSEVPDWRVLGEFEPFAGAEDAQSLQRQIDWDHLLASAASCMR